MKIKTESGAFHVFRILRTFFIVNIGWYFDRIEDVADSFTALRLSFTSFRAGEFFLAVRDTLFNSETGKPLYTAGSFLVASLSIILVFIISILKEKGQEPLKVLEKSVLRHAVFVTAMLFLTLLSFMFVQNAGGFLYANF